MSAFEVSHKHIDALVSARAMLARYHVQIAPKLTDDEFGRVLIRENVKSVDALERNADRAEELASMYTYRRHPMPPVVALIKAVHCLMYQSCEHEGWEKSDAASYCKALVSGLTKCLPGYDEAPWGID